MLPRFIRRPFRYIGDIVRYICGDGSWLLYDYEEIIYNSIFENIEDKEAVLLYKEQLGSMGFVSRYVEHRIAIFIFDKKYDRLRKMPRGVQLTPDTYGGGYFLATVKIKQGRRRNEAVASLIHGYLYGLEFKRSPDHLKGQPFEIVSVQIGGPMADYAREIDREEHGDLEP